jgi:hypothetical protein
MKRLWAPSLLVLAACVVLACGSGGGSGRQLQSISLNATPATPGIQVVATGHFSAPPLTVTPLPVFWSSAPPPSEYTLTIQPYLTRCPPLQPILIAWAPVDPNAPSTGPMSTKMVNVSFACPDV